MLKTVKPCGNCSNSTVPNYSEHCFKLCFDLSTFAEKSTMSTQLLSLVTINPTDNLKHADFTGTSECSCLAGLTANGAQPGYKYVGITGNGEGASNFSKLTILVFHKY